MKALALTSDAAAFSIRTTIVDETFEFRFYWANVVSSWFVSLYDEGGAPVMCGVRVVQGTLPFFQDRARSPRAVFLVSSVDGSFEEPSRDDLGKRIQVYVLEAE